MRNAVAASLPEPAALDRVVVDCTAVSSMESVVIAVFMRYRRKWINAGKDPLSIVFIVSPSLRRTFEITGMADWFTIISAEPHTNATPQGI